MVPTRAIKNNLFQRYLTSVIPIERNWNPNKIYPSNPGQVRICGNTLRDGHQSLNGGLHRINLLIKGAELIEKIRPNGMIFPGNEEIGGGTTVDFPLRFKGENPFRNMEMLSSRLPNTPTSALIRSDSLCGYTINPRDVVKAFIKRYAECGIDIFRNFDAYNNVKNHETVAKSVIDSGKHYQAAITFTSHKDPTLYNRLWVADTARALKDLGAHSIAIKDMAGIASPSLIREWSHSIKDVIPEIPLVIHSHYTTGFAPLVYMQSIEVGANAIDLSISTLSGRSGHPSMEVFTKVLSDLGYNLGFNVDEAQNAMKEVANLYREYHKHYEFCEMKMAGSVDYRVFEKGIPGGQISIFRNELIRNNLGHLFDKVIDQIQDVRDQVGGVALVTPTSEHVARQSTLNAQDNLNKTNENSRLWPGYSEMLRGVMGRSLSKQDEKLQRRALLEWAQEQLRNMKLEKNIKEQMKKDVNTLVKTMWNRVQPILKMQRIEDLIKRIDHLREIDRVKYKLSIKENEMELKMLRKMIGKNVSKLNETYVSFLAMKPSKEDFENLLEDLKETSFQKNLTKNKLSKEQFLELVRASSFCTICPSSVMPDGLEKCKDEVEELAYQYDFEIPERNSVEFLEYALLHSMFKFSQNIALNYFRFHNKKLEHWPENPDPEQAKVDRTNYNSPARVDPMMFPFLTKSKNSQPHLQRFSDEEIMRVLKHEIVKLDKAKKKLDDLEKNKVETEIRKKINEREKIKLSKLITETKSEIKKRLIETLESTQPEKHGITLLKNRSLFELQRQCGL